MDMIDWAEKEIEIACEKSYKEAEDTGEYEYFKGCCRSALKAYESLMEDGHSGTSINITQSILNRLINGQPLSPIEDTEDIWQYSYSKDDVETYRCTRKSSFFKEVDKEGNVKYTDVDSHFCEDKNTGSTYSNGLVRKIYDEMFPISLPYYPSTKKDKVVCEDFLTNEENGDFDTLGIFYIVKANGDEIEVNRFFKESEHKWSEITFEEYNERKIKANQLKQSVEN